MKTAFFCLLFGLTLLPQSAAGADRSVIREFGIGFFQAGNYAAHSVLRQQYRDQLEAMLPDGYRVSFLPAGYKSAGWNRDTSRAMAVDLAADESIDIVVAIGPWTVEDLLAAGFDRPIIAALRFDPRIEGLVDSLDRPIVDNLTLRLRPNKVESDLMYLASLTNMKRLGFLYFPSGDELPAALARVQAVGERLGFEVLTAEGYDNKGTFAFFRAYQELPGRVDAIYIGPLWGFEATKIRPFYDMLLRAKVPVFASEGEYHVTRGALAAGSRESKKATAHYLVWKTIRIMQGMIAADLPVSFADHAGLTINEYVASQTGIALDRMLRLSANIVTSPASEELELLSASEAIGRALDQNPDYRAQYDVLRAATEEARRAWSAYLPHLNLVGIAAHVDNNEVANDGRFRNDQYQASLVLDQKILSLGAIRDIELAADNRDLTAVDLRAAALDLELGVTVAFINYLKAEQLAQVERIYRQRAATALQLARVRDEVGSGDPADILRLEVQRFDAIRASVDSRRNVEIARILFNRLLGRPGDLQLNLSGPLFTDKRLLSEAEMLRRLSRTDRDLARLDQLLMEIAAGVNPALESADLSLARQGTRLSRNSARFIPQIGFQAALNFSDRLATTSFFREESPTWSVAALFELPLFLGTDRIRERSRLKAGFSELEYRKDNTRLAVNSEIQMHLRRMLALAIDFGLAIRSVELADQYAALITDQYNTNQRSVAELLDAISQERKASLEAISIQFGYFQTVAHLVREIGLAPNENGRTANEELFERLRVLVGN